MDSTEESNSDSFRSVIDDLTIKSTDLSSHYYRLLLLLEYMLKWICYQIKNSKGD